VPSYELYQVRWSSSAYSGTAKSCAEARTSSEFVISSGTMAPPPLCVNGGALRAERPYLVRTLQSAGRLIIAARPQSRYANSYFVNAAYKRRTHVGMP